MILYFYLFQRRLHVDKPTRRGGRVRRVRQRSPELSPACHQRSS